MKTRGERLRKARKDAGFKSARQAALALNVPVSTYNAHERSGEPGARDYDPEDAARYARKFRVSDAWLLTGKAVEQHPPTAGKLRMLGGNGSHFVPRTVRVVGYVGAGAEAHYYALAQGDLDEVTAPEGATDNTVAVEIRGTSLGKTFDRWLAFYDAVQSPVTEDLYGHLCVVGLPDERVLVKKLRPVAGGLFDLISEEDVIRSEVDWAAKVKGLAPR